MSNADIDLSAAMLAMVVAIMPPADKARYDECIAALKDIERRYGVIISDLAMAAINIERVKARRAARQEKQAETTRSATNEVRLDGDLACPCCQKKVNAATALDGAHKPKASDYSVCGFCASFLRFTDDMTLRIPTMEEIAELPDEQRIQLQRARRAVARLGAPSAAKALKTSKK